MRLQRGSEKYLQESLLVHWLRLWASIAGGVDSIPGQETKIWHAVVQLEKKSAVGVQGNLTMTPRTQSPE